MDYRQDGFIFTKIPFENKEAVCIQSHRVPETIEYMKKKNIRYIKFHSDRYKYKGIKCLEEVAGQIEGIEIDMETKDLSRIGLLHNLRYLSVTGTTAGQVINFANASSLVECNLNWGGCFLNMKRCPKLKKLTIWNLEEPYLWELKDVHSLEYLSLYECLSLQDLEVIKPLVNLREVSLYNCRNLASIEQIKFMSGTLASLSIIKSKKLNDYSPISKLNKLENLVIKDSGSSPDARFLEALPSLRCGHINICIVDGQVEKLLKLPVKFRNYLHYSHKNIHLVKTTPDGDSIIQKIKSIKDVS